MSGHRTIRAHCWLGIGLLLAAAGCGQDDWQTLATPDLTIHYRRGSYAALNLGEAQGRYDHAYQLAQRTMPGPVKTDPKIKVYLYDQLKSKGFSRVRDREVHYRFSDEFRLTTPHEFLHIFLYEFNPRAPIRLEEGVCRLEERKRKKFKGAVHDIQYYQLVKLVPERRWTVREVFKDHYRDDDDGNIAAAFVAFTMQELGRQRFWEFYRDLDKKNWKDNLSRYFGRDRDIIDADFKAFVRAIPDPPEAFKYRYSAKTAHLHH